MPLKIVSSSSSYVIQISFLPFFHQRTLNLIHAHQNFRGNEREKKKKKKLDVNHYYYYYYYYYYYQINASSSVLLFIIVPPPTSTCSAKQYRALQFGSASHRTQPLELSKASVWWKVAAYHYRVGEEYVCREWEFLVISSKINLYLYLSQSSTSCSQ